MRPSNKIAILAAMMAAAAGRPGQAEQFEGQAAKFHNSTNIRVAAAHWRTVVLRAPQQRKKHSNRLHISKRTRAKHRRKA